MRVGVGLLLGVVTVLVVLLDALLFAKFPAFRAAAPGTGLLLAFLSAAALREFYGIVAAAGVDSLPAYGASCSLVLLAARSVLPLAGVRPGDAAAAAAVGLLLAVLLPGVARIAFRPEGAKPGADAKAASPSALRPLAGTALGLVLVHLPIALLLEMRLSPSAGGMSTAVPAGLVLATMLALACKVGDSAGYFVGRTVGRRPLCWVSPKKTWEGAIAGVAAGTASAAVLGAFFGLGLREGISFGLVVNLAGQGGDLLESWVKRCCDVKDSGRTFGEMGGALDLVDAFLLAGPAGYLFHRIVLA
jgi:phosphatidate cytidylyltransferase